MHFSSIQPILSCESRHVGFRWKRSWLPSNFFLGRLLRALWAMKCSVLHFCRAEHLEVAPSWWRGPGLRKRPVAIGENFGWIYFLSRDVHKCNRLFLDSNKEGILSIALLELFRMVRATLHCPFHESSLLIFHWMGCRRYFVTTLMIFGLLTGSPHRLSRCTPGRSPFHPKQTLCGVTFQRAHPLTTTPCQCPRSRTATLRHGAAAPFLPLRWPDCTLNRLCAEEHDRPVTQSTATPEPSSFEDDPHPRSEAGRPLEPWVCHHTLEPTAMSRVSNRPSHLKFGRFTSLACHPGAPLTATKTRLAVGQG